MKWLPATLMILGTLGSAAAEVSMQHPVDLTSIARTPPNGPCGQPCNRTAVIFVHGFTGDYTTWKNGNVEWPQLLANDPDIGPQIDVYRLDYFSTLNQGPSLVHLSEIIAEQLDSKFFGVPSEQNPTTKYSKIVMICHSLGGILCRNHLLHVKLRWGHQFLSLLRATVTLGTPLRGADLSNFWFVRASSNEQLRVLRPEEVNDFLQLLNNAEDMIDQKRQLVNCPELVLYAGYEELETPLFENQTFPTLKVVEKDSATAGVPQSRQRKFYVDHRGLARPASRGDDQYRWVHDILLACQTNGQKCGRPAPAACGSPPWIR